MKNELKESIRLTKELTTRINFLTPLSEDDYQKATKYFSRLDPAYGNSWTYILGNILYENGRFIAGKFDDGKSFFVITANALKYPPYQTAFFIIRPVGENVMQKVKETALKIKKIYNRPVYVKKLDELQFKQAIKLGFEDAKNHPWHPSAPLEDDTYPEVIIDIQRTLELAKTEKKKSIHRKLRYYKSLKKALKIKLYKKEKIKEVLVLAKKFYLRNAKKKKNLSSFNDYLNQIHFDFPNQIKFLTFDNSDKLKAFSLITLINEEYATFNLQLNSETPSHLSDFVFLKIFMFLKKKGVKKINLGGSETKSLHNFKQHFQPSELKQAYWAFL